MTRTDRNSALAIVGLALALNACARLGGSTVTPGSEPDYRESLVKYNVQPGDQLSGIALRITGDVANWQRIAEFNAIENPRTLRAGTVLEIPADLLPESAGNDTAETQSPSEDASRQNESSPVVVSAASIERSFTPQSLAAEEMIPADGRRWVQVIGTYYPKGVYSDPSDASRLLLRVAPGTQYELKERNSNWFGVVLKDGIGYLRTSDARELHAGDSL